jgi:hypothetical protein
MFRTVAAAATAVQCGPAAALDREYCEKHDKVMPLHELERELQHMLGRQRPISRATLRSWRKKSEYRNRAGLLEGERTDGSVPTGEIDSFPPD